MFPQLSYKFILFKACVFLPGLILILILSQQSVLAQNQHEDTDVSSALEFKLGPLFMIGNLNGSAISWKWDNDAASGNRIGLSVESGLNFRSIEYERDDDIDLDNYDFHFQIHADRIHYLNPGSRTTFYTGYGPRFGFAYGHDEVGGEPYGTTRTTISRQVEAGLGISAGVEWFITPSLSLAGEYSLSAMYSVAREDSRTPLNENRDTRKIFNLSEDAVQVRIAIYFQ